MIHPVQYTDYDGYSSQLDQMFHLRAEVFNERLGWDVQVKDGREIDEFDQMKPLYLLSINGAGNLAGSLRLLPTTGPNMLSDVFSELLPADETVRSPLIWESSRFCISKAAASQQLNNGLNRATAELFAGLCEIGMQVGLQAIVTVYDSRVKRIARRAGCEGELLGSPKKIGKVTAYAGLFPTNEDMLARIHQSTGLTGSVVSDFCKPASAWQRYDMASPIQTTQH